MKGYQIPRLRDAAFAGAVWLFGLGVLLMLSPTASGYLVTRMLTGGFTVAGAIFLLKIGLDINADEDIQPVLVKEPAHRPDRTRRVA